LTVDLAGSDPDDLLLFDLDPPRVLVDSATATFVKLRLRPRSTFWRGRPRTVPFQVWATPEGQAQIAGAGTRVQAPKLPPWFWRAVVAAVLATIALVVLWYALLRPTIQSSARDAAQQELSEIADRVDAAEEAAGAAQESAGAAEQSASD